MRDPQIAAKKLSELLPTMPLGLDLIPENGGGAGPRIRERKGGYGPSTPAARLSVFNAHALSHNPSLSILQPRVVVQSSEGCHWAEGSASWSWCLILRQAS
jgi:hypothetical protein